MAQEISIASSPTPAAILSAPSDDDTPQRS